MSFGSGPCVCMIHCPGWDLGRDLFQSANLKAITMLFRIRSTTNSLEMRPNVIDHFVVPLSSTPFPLQSLWQSLIHWCPLLLSSSQNSRTLVPLLCWVLPVQSGAVEAQRRAAVMRTHLLVLRTTLPLLRIILLSQSFRLSPLLSALWHRVVASSWGDRDQKKVKTIQGNPLNIRSSFYFAPECRKWVFLFRSLCPYLVCTSGPLNPHWVIPEGTKQQWKTHHWFVVLWVLVSFPICCFSESSATPCFLFAFRDRDNVSVLAPYYLEPEPLCEAKHQFYE